MSRQYSVVRSFKFAFDGLKEALINEPNFQIHSVIGLTTLIAGFILELPSLEWIVLAFTITFVLILELFNTAIEAIVDHLSPGIHPKAKVAKDVSAAAVLLASICAVLVGIVIFLPRILRLLEI